MKDLKHLIYFERLLENADNELIEKKKAEGGICLGYTCFHIPEVILNVDKCFSTRLRAPNTGSIDIATYYMSNYTCEYARALLERAIEGGYQFLNALIGVDACSMMNRSMEHFEILQVNENPDFFVTHTDMPFKITDYTIEGYRRQMRVRVLDRLTEVFGVDTSDDALRKAVEEHNEVCRIISEIGQLRKRKNPVITGYEFHVLNLVTYVCPKSEILPYLRETLEEIKARRPDRKNPFRARVAIVGSEIDDPNLTKLIEGCGALVVSDRYCFGSTPGREVIELNDKEDVLTQICRHYMEVSECARYISDEKVMQRRETSDRLAKEYGAEGIIYEQMKYCDYWGFERALVSHIMHDEYGWPVLSIDRLYNNGNSGQLRTRCQAFVESLEIKRIHKEEGVE
ncbi:MAG: 2-hydroxyacyl-CoA dehydratase [Oscillospiraceae bacterium]|nr:2-hydroxyacyl-CoA dehydratase [Oscillospiraceae bacterium]MBQ3757624.1 2-hydroxyacyl-CoA dehydratase [Oscillospiraceae bacterium]MBR2799513.1 2-hydroxyacyl-CoA dehydratase [Oscillospiraceae bacterium]MBR2807483.1 2-hydroxyacyl-CoA dehydratase [Oscillospiraceae bacterium]MBR3175132.1 2-hydroxyacyl-CoA dehydratase [Oscillospiraceae bacterium]